MKFKIPIGKRKFLEFSFGYSGKTFKSMYAFDITTIWLDKYGNIEDAKCHLMWFKHPKYK